MNLSVKKEYVLTTTGPIETAFLKKNTSILFGVTFAVFLVIMISTTSFLAKPLKLDNDNVFKYLMFGCVIILALKEYIVEKHSLKLILHILIILALVVLIKRVNSFAASASIVLIYSARNEDYKYIAKIALVITTIMLVLIIGLSLAGVIVNYQFDVDTVRPRSALGFRYVLFPSAYFFNIVALILYLKRDKINWLIIILETLACIWLYKATDSRLSFGFTMILIFVSILIKIPFRRFIHPVRFVNNDIGGFIKLMIVLSFAICAAFSIIFTLKYNDQNETYSKINKVFSDRLYFGQKSYDMYGTSLFGQRIEWIGNGLNTEGERNENEYLYVDNLYLQFLQQYGWVFFTFVMVLLSYAMYKLVKNKEWILIFIMLLIAAHSMLDDLTLHLWYNTFWLALAPLVINDSVFIKMKGYLIDKGLNDGQE